MITVWGSWIVIAHRKRSRDHIGVDCYRVVLTTRAHRLAGSFACPHCPHPTLPTSFPFPSFSTGKPPPPPTPLNLSGTSVWRQSRYTMSRIECRIKVPHNQRCRAKIALHPPKTRCRTFPWTPSRTFLSHSQQAGGQSLGGGVAAGWRRVSRHFWVPKTDRATGALSGRHRGIASLVFRIVGAHRREFPQ